MSQSLGPLIWGRMTLPADNEYADRRLFISPIESDPERPMTWRNTCGAAVNVRRRMFYVGWFR